ncbi:MAG: methyltransferase, partial [Rhodospirillaceae bacterium]|nr:methyltransferase [Rhodospirillaceae bacterium]
VQPGGHYFGAQHTIARYEDAFYAPLVSDWRNFETWSDAGAKDTAQRANAIWKRMLTEYEKPAIETDVEEHMRDYITRRKEQIHGRAV